MARTVPSGASTVVGRRDDLVRPRGRSAVILEDDSPIVWENDDAARFRG
jgi:hypothetical protein